MNGTCRRFGRSVALTVAASIAAVGLAGGTVAQPAPPPGLGAVEALDALEACAADARAVLVAVAVADVDPGTRAAATDLVARQLQRVGQRVGVDSPVAEVIVIGVTETPAPAASWEAVDPSSRPRLEAYVRTAADQVAADEGSPGWIPLAATLTLAEDELAIRRDALAADGVDACELVVIVGDGRLDLADGADLVCAPGGPLDRLREAGAAIVATAPAVAGPAAEAATALATGSAGEVACGTPPAVAGPALAVDRPAELVAGFDLIGSALAGRTAVGAVAPACAGALCDEGTYPIRIDRTLSRLSITVVLPTETAEVVVGLPRGIRFPVSDRSGGAIDLGSVVIDTTWVLPDVVRFDAPVSAADADWAGDWTITVVEPEAVDGEAVGGSQLLVGLEPGLVAEFPAAPQLVAGRAISLGVDLVDGGGRRVDVRQIGDAVDVEIVVRASDGSVLSTNPLVPDELGGLVGEVATPEGSDDDPAELQVDAVVVARSGDIPLRRVVTSVVTPLASGSAWPTLESSRLVLRGDADDVAAGSVVVTTGTGLDACVWLDGASTDVSGLVLAGGARSSASCEIVEAGSTRTLPVRLDLDGADAGRVTGTASIALGVVGSDTFDLVEVPVEVLVASPVDLGVRAALTALLTLGGIILPLVVIWVWDWARARFRPPRSAVVAEMGVAVWSDGSIYRVDTDGSPLLLGNDMFEPAELRRGRRQSWRGLELAVRNSRTPLSPPVGTASSPDGPVVGGQGAIVDEDTVVGRVPLDLAGSWIFELHPDATREAAGDPQAPDFYAAYGRLLLIRATPDAPPIDLVRLPHMAQRLARTVRSARRAPGPDRDMLEFVDTNVSRPRDLPRSRRTGPEASEVPPDPGGDPVDLPEVADGAFDPYDFSDLAEVFAGDEPEPALDPADAPHGRPGPVEDGDGDDGAGDDAEVGIVFEDRVNPSAFRADPLDPVASDPLLDPGIDPRRPPSPPTAPPDDPAVGWARRARPRWPTAHRDDD